MALDLGKARSKRQLFTGGSVKYHLPLNVDGLPINPTRQQVSHQCSGKYTLAVQRVCIFEDFITLNYVSSFARRLGRLKQFSMCFAGLIF